MNPVTATLNGRALLACRVTLSRGTQPSRLEATLPPGWEPARGEALALNMGDHATVRELRQFVCREVLRHGDGRATVIGSDIRADWQQPVALDCNVVRADGGSLANPLSATECARLLLAQSHGANRDIGVPGGELAFPAGTPAPLALRASGTLAEALAALASNVGLGLGIDDDGNAVFEAATELDASTVMELARAEPANDAPRVIGGESLELVEISHWQPVLPDDSGTWRPLEDVLAAWGVSPALARRACLSDAGFETLLPRTTPASRLATLKQHAFRAFRADVTGTLLPIGGIDADGHFLPPALTATPELFAGVAPSHPATEHARAEARIAPFTLDLPRGLLHLNQPPYALARGTDPTFQGREITGEPRLRLTLARPATQPPFAAGPEDGPVLRAPHLRALWRDGVMLNRATLESAADELASRYADTPATTARLAGVSAHVAAGAVSQVEISAGPEGLTTRLRIEATQPVFTAASRPRESAGMQAPLPTGLHQPINAFRAGPLVLRADGDAPESESVLAMRADARDTRTGALALHDPGALAFAYHLPSTDAARFGRWFFVAGVEADADGLLRVLGPDDRHAPQDASDLQSQRLARPQGLRGLMLSLGDEQAFLDPGLLVSDARGQAPGRASSLVHDLDGSSLSTHRRGGLQYLTVLALSPAHLAETGHGWVPALNLREGETANPRVLGRGLFAEGDGRSLGRLTATLQSGPILADAARCEKHRHGLATEDGLYRESSGHISTEAFFKVPGDPVHDAPIQFYPQPFAGGVPPWPPHEAQLKYDANTQHPWNRTRRDGMWKIQYRVPFLPDLPPTWDPPRKPPAEPPTDNPPPVHVPAMATLPDAIYPALSPYELWAPSHDWIPASSDPAMATLPLHGPSLQSIGYARETGGVPEPDAGGCVLLPPTRALPDAQEDSGARARWFVLHPEVQLGFGHPDHETGGVHGGWRAGLHEGALEFAPTESEGLLRIAADAEVTGKLTVGGLIDPTGLELTPVSANPGGVAGNTLWIEQASGRARIGANVLAFVSELAAENVLRVIAYTGSGSSGLTVALTGVNRAIAMLWLHTGSDAVAPAFALPAGASGSTRWRGTDGGTTDTTISLDAPSSGVAQTLTINHTHAAMNASGGSYRLLVIGAPT